MTVPCQADTDGASVLSQEAYVLRERKAQQIEARAMDHRLRFDAQELRAIIAGHEVVSRLGQLIEAAQRDSEAHDHLLRLAAELREPTDRAAQALGSIVAVTDWYWDRVIDKDAEAKKLSAMLKKVGAKTTEVAVAGLFNAALASKLLPK